VTTFDDDLEERELMLNRFRRLVGEMQRGQSSRNTFAPWEIDLLLDLDTCEIDPRRRGDIFRQYERAVEKQLEAGPGPPMRLSHFLVLKSRQS
jgi:hypothetical protein